MQTARGMGANLTGASWPRGHGDHGPRLLFVGEIPYKRGNEAFVGDGGNLVKSVGVGEICLCFGAFWIRK